MCLSVTCRPDEKKGQVSGVPGHGAVKEARSWSVNFFPSSFLFQEKLTERSSVWGFFSLRYTTGLILYRRFSSFSNNSRVSNFIC